MKNDVQYVHQDIQSIAINFVHLAINTLTKTFNKSSIDELEL